MADTNPNAIIQVAGASARLLENTVEYENGTQPGGKHLDLAFETIAKAISVALAPLGDLVWGYDRIKGFVQDSLEQKLQDLSPQSIITPNPIVAGPVLESLRFAKHNKYLKELFINVLATAMNKATAPTAHPSFVEIIKQLSSDEIKLLNLKYDATGHAIVQIRAITNNESKSYLILATHFSILPKKAGNKYPEHGSIYLTNLERLGLLSTTYTAFHTQQDLYNKLEKDPYVQHLCKIIRKRGDEPRIKKGLVQLTPLGKQFVKSCIPKTCK